MPKPFDFGSVNLTAGEDATNARLAPDTPFRIAILGDFSGRANRGICEPKTIAQRRAVQVDRDNFDHVLASLGARIQLPIGDGSLHLTFSELDDFHPDRIFQHLEAFSRLRDLRRQLQDPATFQQAADELGLRPTSRNDTRRPDTTAARAPSPVRLASTSLLDEMIEQTESREVEGRTGRKPDEVREFAEQVAAQHLVAAQDARQPEVLKVIDRGVAALMRAVLHNRDLQAMESIWRAVYLLVREVETDSQLKIYLIDVSKQEFSADLKNAPHAGESGIYRLLVEQSVRTPGAEPWAVIVGSYIFGPDDDDVAILNSMAQVASEAGAPFLAQGSSAVPGGDSVAQDMRPRTGKMPAENWTVLRRRPEAGFLGLALPRFMLRIPYGKKTSPIESFEFEEFQGLPHHQDYLWGNPAFVVALLLAESFSESGWRMIPGSVSEMRGLPLHVFGKNGAAESTPCAEFLLTDEAVERLLELGLIPLVSFKDRDMVRIARFQSLADPPQRLMGRWDS